MPDPIAEGWNQRLNEARDTWPRRKGVERPMPYGEMSTKVEELLGEGGAASPSTIYRTFDGSRRASVETLEALARILEVRPEWLLRGEGQMTEEMQERTEQAVALEGRLENLISSSLPLHDAAEALVVEIAQRWLNLPLYCYRHRVRPTVEDVRDAIRGILMEVIGRIPRPGRRPGSPDDLGTFDRRQWDRFAVSLLSALWDGMPEPMAVDGAWRKIDVDPETGTWLVEKQARPPFTDPTREEDNDAS